MTSPRQRTRSWWGWGWQEDSLSDQECSAYGSMLPGLPQAPYRVPGIEDLDLPEPRITPPESLATITSTSRSARVSHSYGKSYRDVIRALRGQIDAPPDVVAFPTSDSDVVSILDWAGSNDVAVIPYGGGSSVVGGVECAGEGFSGVVSVDLTRMNKVLEIDPVSHAALIQAGAMGPVLEDQLRPSGYTLRHFPQSFEFSTLGGWLATRAGGHYATLHTHIDDFVESIRVITPIGISESWRLPGSGAGPSPDRMFLGSEGTLGLITEAWMRIQQRPQFRLSTSVTFTNAHDSFNAVREIAQSGLYPANCRLLDPGEAALSGASKAGEWVLVLGVESAHHPVDTALGQLIDIARSHRGTPATEPSSADDPDRAAASDHEGKGQSDGPGSRDRTAEKWRSSFLRMPYVRDAMARMSAIVETFETATTWDRVDALYANVMAELGDVIEATTGSPGLINCRFTHVYPDGAAPYFTVIATARRGSEAAMWDEIKTAAMEILTRHRATVTHHHAVGRDHRPGYDRQRPDVFATALGAAKAALDPTGILNPGVLLPTRWAGRSIF